MEPFNTLVKELYMDYQVMPDLGRDRMALYAENNPTNSNVTRNKLVFSKCHQLPRHTG